MLGLKSRPSIKQCHRPIIMFRDLLEGDSLEQVQLFLNNSRELMNCRSMKDVYIGKDWTKKQQREQMILRVALRERREESDRSRDGKPGGLKEAR